MTSQSDRIQSIVEQINTILVQSSSEDGFKSDQYRALEQAQQRLLQLQQSSPSLSFQSETSSDSAELIVQDWQSPAPVLAESAQQVLQAIVQEMAYLRMNTVQPLREEITQLQHERNQLATEVKQLHHQRQQLLIAQQTDQQQMINGFLHALMGRLQEQLTLQVAQSIAALKGQSSVTSVTANDQQVVQLDSILKVVFDSLQSNVTTYQDSLEQGLRKMHGLGQQGEAMFTAFVNRLASQLGQEAFLHLQSSPPADFSLLREPHGPNTDATMLANERSTIVEGDSDDSDKPDHVTEMIPSRSGQDKNEQSQFLAQPTCQIEVDQGRAIQPGSEDVLGKFSSSQSAQFAVPLSSENDTSENMELEVKWNDLAASVDANLALDNVLGQSDLDLTSSTDQTNDLVNQIINQLDNETIDAVEAIDQLDLGFGLDDIDLAEVPVDDISVDDIEETIASTLLADDLTDILSQNTEVPAQDTEEIGEIGEIGIDGQISDQSPMILVPGFELDPPLSPLASIHLDDNDVDVERFLDSINSPTSQGVGNNEQDADLLGEETTEAFSLLDDEFDGVNDDELVKPQSVLQSDVAVSDLDEAALLRQQLAAELHDESFGVDLLTAEDLSVLEPSLSSDSSSILPSIGEDSRSIFESSDISFTISSPTHHGEGETTDPTISFETTSATESSDLYAAFASLAEGSLDSSNLEIALDESDSVDTGASEGERVDEVKHLGSDVSLSSMTMSDCLTTPSPPPLDTINHLTDLIDQSSTVSGGTVASSQTTINDHSFNHPFDLLSSELPDPHLPEFEGSVPHSSTSPTNDLQENSGLSTELGDKKIEVSHRQPGVERRPIPPFSPTDSGSAPSFLAGNVARAETANDKEDKSNASELIENFLNEKDSSSPFPSAIDLPLSSSVNASLQDVFAELDSEPSADSPLAESESRSDAIQNFFGDVGNEEAMRTSSKNPPESYASESFQEFFGGDTTNTTSDILSSHHDSLQDFLNEGVNEGGTAESDGLSELSPPQSDGELSGTVANLFSDLLVDVSDEQANASASSSLNPSAGRPLNPSSVDIDCDVEGESTIEGEETVGLTPISSTLGDLFVNDASSAVLPSDSQPLEGDTISDKFTSFLTSPPETLPSESVLESDNMLGFDDSFEDNFEEDGLASLLQDLQDQSPNSSQLSGNEDAKTLADLLRGQELSRPPAASSSGSSSDSSESTTTVPPVPSDSQLFSNWFEDLPDESDEESTLEKKNNKG